MHGQRNIKSFDVI